MVIVGGVEFRENLLKGEVVYCFDSEFEEF